MLVTEKQPNIVNFINSVQTPFHDMFIFCYFVALITFIIYYYYYYYIILKCKKHQQQKTQWK